VSALATHTEWMNKFVADIQASGLTDTLTKRDSPFGDYRIAEARDSA
jgi:hypothetical protein